jgi:aminopeptidase N
MKSTIYLALLLSVFLSPALALDRTDRNFDQVHLLLRVRPDIRAGTVAGTAELTFVSLADGLRVLRLHSRETKVFSIVDGAGRPLAFESKADELHITLAGPLAKGVEGKVAVHYESKPTRGMYFHFPTEDHPEVPLSCYTQGEGTDNRHWFPSYDLPDDRMTVELQIDVPDALKTVGNGLLVSEEYIAGPRRIDHWVMSARLPSYLVSVIVGDYETWVTEHDGVLLEVNAFRGQLEEARNAFDRTAPMLTFFREYLGRPYPYPRYAQTFVWDFLYGGMENTTATTMNMRLLHGLEVRPSFDADAITAHELAHQWFGDLVTCETFEHLWLNEGFATYLTDLFFEEADGIDEFQVRRRSQNRDYLAGTPDPANLGLVRSPRGDLPLELFGGKQYNRGAAILHQLRLEIGDEAFQAGVRLFLDRHDDDTATSEDLKRAFADAAGRDLSWFFDQWVYGAGYPVLRVTHDYVAEAKVLRIRIRQKQPEGGGQGLFRLTVPIRIKTAEGFLPARATVFEREHEFELPCASPPLHVRVDDGCWLLARVENEQSFEQWANQAEFCPDAAGRIDALYALRRFGRRGAVVIVKALREDSFYAVRQQAAEVLAELPESPHALEGLLAAVEDEDLRVREAAYLALGSRTREEAGEVVQECAWREKQPYVLAAAARATGRLRPDEAFEALAALLEVDSHREVVRHGALDGLRSLGDPRAVALAKPLLDYRYGRGAMSMMRKAALDLILALAADDPTTVETVLALTRDPYFRMRTWAAEACATYGMKGAAGRLKEMEKSDPDAGVRWAAKRALEQLSKE